MPAGRGCSGFTCRSIVLNACVGWAKSPVFQGLLVWHGHCLTFGGESRRSVGGRTKMLSDTKIWYAANVLLTRHGAEAALVAARKADELMAKGDLEGRLVLTKIVSAILELRRDEPREDESIH